MPKARQVLSLARLADKSTSWLLQMVRSLFPDDSDLALVLRELLRRKNSRRGLVSGLKCCCRRWLPKAPPSA